jgi:hypothetical protein
MSATNSALAKDAAIVLDWADVAGANLYHIQVSLYADFSVILEEQTALATSAHAFSDTGTDDAKRFWRWRYSTDTGTTWSKWSEVASYWMNTTFTADVVPAVETWTMVDPDDVSDACVMDVFPLYSVTPISIRRVQERNRLGELLSEYLTTKDTITLSYPEDCYIGHELYREILRFHSDVRTFFILASTNNGRDDVVRVWKVEFADDPSFEMVALGRQDILTGEMELEEV